MRTWLLLPGGLIVWTFHFFALYIVGGVFPDMPVAAILTWALPALRLSGRGCPPCWSETVAPLLPWSQNERMAPYGSRLESNM